MDASLTNAEERWGYSDAVEIYATRELPHRGTDNALRTVALRVLAETGEILFACKEQAIPELQDVWATDEADEVDEWSHERHHGERLVGAHPMRHDIFYPDREDVFQAYVPTADSTIKLGAY